MGTQSRSLVCVLFVAVSCCSGSVKQLRGTLRALQSLNGFLSSTLQEDSAENLLDQGLNKDRHLKVCAEQVQAKTPLRMVLGLNYFCYPKLQPWKISQAQATGHTEKDPTAFKIIRPC